ncbi:hypothetical protein PHLCEN_2v5768 [Hermanssonia centrifuga]|uniref:PEBP-like protein n=1 Tax=Hermanssonia centrifuga TaxID=98765 RepID=A0A2R6P1I0_9APHY|nr:hypothetical protein PHLCEN_2v5768 [Hermanssonia centrifuga]
MLALRRVPTKLLYTSLVRGNGTVATPLTAAAPAPPPPSSPPKAKAASPSSKPSAPKPASKPASVAETSTSKTIDVDEADSDKKDRKRKRRFRFPTQRPSISLERPRAYSRPIGVGVLRAYDEALAYIKKDSNVVKAELEEYKASLAKAESSPESDSSKVERLKEKVKILEIQSEINLPSVRWKARNGLADLTKPIYRHLVEQRWREDGVLDMLMERIYQMNVVPDLLPNMRPTLDLRVNFPEAPPDNVYQRTRVKRDYEKVEPGIFLLPEQTRKPPMLYTTVFHTDTRLYTLLMVDLDVPDQENASYKPYLHWMQPNIALSALSPSPIPLTTTHTRYIPPHPQRGTPYHRYVILLLPQSSPTERIKIPAPTDEQRLGFNFRAFAAQYGLDGAKGGGVHMWREVWDETVTKIYTDIFEIEEPIYGRMPTPDRYVGLRGTKKYIQS